jgi:hypothetical protein
LILMLLFVLLLRALFGGLPAWGHNWGYAPSSVAGVLLLFLIVWLFMGHRF